MFYYYYSGMHDQVKKEAVEDHNWFLGIKKQLICCSDCSENLKKEAEAVMNEFLSSSSSSTLPSWLQHYKDENIKQLQVGHIFLNDKVLYGNS